MARGIRRALWVGLSAALLFAGVGCGRKAPPVPPGTLRPAPVRDLTYRITLKGAELSWSVPVRNTDGSPIVKLKGFELVRRAAGLEGACPECPAPGEPARIWIPYGRHPARGARVTYEDRTLHEGLRYTYTVEAVKGRLSRSGPSNPVSFAWHVPPGPVEALKAEFREGRLVLSWQAPSAWEDGRPLQVPLRFEVERKAPWDPAPKVVAAGLERSGWEDPDPPEGALYWVRAVADWHGTGIPSRRSGPLSAGVATPGGSGIEPGGR